MPVTAGSAAFLTAPGFTFCKEDLLALLSPYADESALRCSKLEPEGQLHLEGLFDLGGRGGGATELARRLVEVFGMEPAAVFEFGQDGERLAISPDQGRWP